MMAAKWSVFNFTGANASAKHKDVQAFSKSFVNIVQLVSLLKIYTYIQELKNVQRKLMFSHEDLQKVERKRFTLFNLRFINEALNCIQTS